jgi:hypothetical protein
MLGSRIDSATVRLAPPPPDSAKIVLPWLEDTLVQRHILQRFIFAEGRWHNRWVGQLLREDWESRHREEAR